jgi:hypothetical protein
MKMSTEINELADAFSKAQGLMKNASKDASNPFFKSSYATLASVIEALREPFALHGLSFMQPCSFREDGSIMVETIILHKSGQYMTSEIVGRPIKADPQTLGSLISYLKRYGLQAMVGIASADDDAEDAMARPQQQYQQRPPQQNVQRPPQLPPQQENKPEFDKYTMEIVGLVKKLSDNGNDKEKIALILKEMEVKDSKEIQSLDEMTKAEIIENLKYKVEEANL